MTQTTIAIRFVEGKQYYGISETGREVKYTVKKITPKFVTVSQEISDFISVKMRYSEVNGVETVIDEITPELRYTVRADNPVDESFTPVATEKKVPHVQTLEEKDRARTNMLVRKYASEKEWILRVYRDAMAYMTEEEYEKRYGYKPTACDKVEEYLYEGEGETDTIFDYCRGLNFKPRGCKEFKDMGEGYDYELVKYLSDVISRIGTRLTEEETSATAQPADDKAHEASQPEALYEEDSYSDYGGDNSAQEEDIPESDRADIEESLPLKFKVTCLGECHSKGVREKRESPMSKEICEMVRKYAENRTVQRAILEGVKIFRKGIEMRKKEGLTSEGLEYGIASVKEEYRKLRRENFLLRRELLRVMNASEITHACEKYKAKLRENQRRNCGK